jgi:hypothetical protein
LGCEAELTFGVAGLVDSSATVKIPGAGCDLENVELPSSAGKWLMTRVRMHQGELLARTLTSCHARVLWAVCRLRAPQD